ncbi:glycoside hydrolase superfamily [Chytridium lagenaria]|nr:glycoside hydrolase superfamily [Chytridium lagenaria]
MLSLTRSWAPFAVLASLLLQQHQVSAFIPEDGKIWLGAWYQRPQGDKPTLLNSRLSRNLSFFQTDFNINMEIGLDDPTPEITTQALDQVDETGTNAIVYWTIYPKGGLDEVTDAQINDVADRIKQAADRGHRVLIRYAPEMNGNWFAYGQQPERFISHWRRVIPMMKARIGAAGAENVNFIWAPNSGNGYPFRGGKYENLTLTATLDQFSDPYTIYYPGDDYVDWVGLSIYHYGSWWPWRQNVPPGPGQFSAQMSGNALPPQEWRDQGTNWGFYDFYGMFSGDGVGSAGLRRNWTIPNVSAGGKPFILAETGATFHYGWNPNGPNFTELRDTPIPSVTFPSTRLEVKRGWWNEIFDYALEHPNFKAVCSFEFSKNEEDTIRAFGMMGQPPSGGDPQDDVVARALVEDLAGRGNIEWASPLTRVLTTSTSAATTARTTASATTATTATPTVVTTTQKSASVAVKGQSGLGVLEMALFLPVMAAVLALFQ